MPYVQAPVCYVKSSKSSNQTTLKSKDDSSKSMKKRSPEATPSLRYVPHPSCVQAPPPNCVPVPTYNYVPTPTYYQPNYALRNGQVVQVGAVVRPYPQPYVTLTPGWVSYSPTVQHQHCTGSNKSSKLNPLSEPYQPKKTTSEENNDDDSRSNCSSPELVSVSRAETPSSSTHFEASTHCPKCGGQLNGSHDTDSGVGTRAMSSSVAAKIHLIQTLQKTSRSSTSRVSSPWRSCLPGTLSSSSSLSANGCSRTSGALLLGNWVLVTS